MIKEELKNEEMINIPSLSVKELINEMSALYNAVIQSGISFKEVPAAMLWGAPGVGKSEAVYQVAANLEKATGKRVSVTDVRLLLFSPVDLRGVPVADSERKFSDWLMPRIFDLDASKDCINILFLDELTAAPASVQAAAYQITLNRRVGEHTLPENTLVIAAGNRTTDHSVAYRMPNALANRLMHFQIEVSFDSWLEYALNNAVNPYILGYLSYDSGKLLRTPQAAEIVAYPTPRSWMALSRVLNALEPKDEQDIRKLSTLIKANIGVGEGIEFINWCRVYKNLPDVKQIFSGEKVEYPRSADELYALIGALTSAFIDRVLSKNKLSDIETDNVCRYVNGFIKEYTIIFYRNILLSEAGEALSQSEAFRIWLSKNKDFYRQKSLFSKN